VVAVAGLGALALVARAFVELVLQSDFSIHA
jgi:hypothetical protein